MHFFNSNECETELSYVQFILCPWYRI